MPAEPHMQSCTHTCAALPLLTRIRTLIERDSRTCQGNARVWMPWLQPLTRKISRAGSWGGLAFAAVEQRKGSHL